MSHLGRFEKWIFQKFLNLHEDILWKQIYEHIGAHSNSDNHRSSHTSMLVR